MSDQAEAPERGIFTVTQDGMIVASGSGPMDRIREEAARYAAAYRQDGPVTVRVRKLRPRKETHA